MMEKALQILLLLSLGGAVMGLVLMLLRRILGKRLPSAVYYYAWLLVLVRLVLPMPGLVPMCGEEAPADPDSPTVTALAEKEDISDWQAADRIWMQQKVEEYTFYSPVNETAWTSPAVPTPADPAETAESSPAKQSIPWDALLAAGKDILSRPDFWLWVWTAGAVLCAAGYVVGYTRFTRALKKTLSPARESDLLLYALVPPENKPRLYRSRCVKTPMLLGLWEPVLVLPDRAYSPLMLENILRHELTHYRRGDIAYKWFAMAVFSLHWFNPLMALFRRELDRTCELSCDERILRDMTDGEKRDYGETLLTLAADRPLPKSVVATTFATEKRTLKERLEQIMTYKHRGKAGLALALAAILLLGGCGAVLGPEAASQPETIQPETLNAQLAGGASDEVRIVDSEEENTRETVSVERDTQGGEVTVSTVDELLAAIGSDTTIYLEPGEYNLSQAETYSQALEGGWYTWQDAYGGDYELVIEGVEDLTIIGGGEATICTDPRGVEVMIFRGCENIDLSGVTLGHTELGSVCKGGVLYLDSSENITVTDSGLYGCGTWGITAVNSRNIYASNVDIYDCSYGAVQADSCYDIRLENCSIYDCSKEFRSMELIRFSNCYGAALVNCEVYNNQNEMFLESEYSEEVYLLGTKVEGNTFSQAVIYAYPYNPVVDGCSFADNGDASLYGVPQWKDTDYMPALSPEGTELDSGDLEAMTLEACTYAGPAAVETVSVERVVTADGTAEVYVSTVDELLAAIAPDTTVYLAAGDYKLSDAQGYGSWGGQYYYWLDAHDGPQLVISGVTNFHLVGEGKDSVNILAVPRYAEVITFNACESVSLTDITAGHTQSPNSCAGGVVKFQDTENALVERCGLFGCGILGVTAKDCRDIQVIDTEIYECSNGAVLVSGSENVAFINCDIHDCGAPLFQVSSGSVNVTVDGKDLIGYGMRHYSLPDDETEIGEYVALYGDYRLEGYTEANMFIQVEESFDGELVRIERAYALGNLAVASLVYTHYEGSNFLAAEETFAQEKAGYQPDVIGEFNGHECIYTKNYMMWYDAEADLIFELIGNVNVEEDVRDIAEKIVCVN